jgi:hypothetical protein
VKIGRGLLAGLMCIQGWAAGCDPAPPPEQVMSKSGNFTPIDCPDIHSAFGNIIYRYCFSSVLPPLRVREEVSDFGSHIDFDQLVRNRTSRYDLLHQYWFGDQRYILRPSGQGSYIEILKRNTFAQDLEAWITNIHPDVLPAKCFLNDVALRKNISIIYCDVETKEMDGNNIDIIRFALNRISDHSLLPNVEYVYAYYPDVCGLLGLMTYDDFISYFSR